MHGLLVRIAAVALCAGSLCACGMVDSNEPSFATPGGNNTVAMAGDINSAIRQAQLMRVKGDTVGATRILSQLMLASPDDPRIVGEYGKLLVQEGRSGDAAQFLRRAVELQPNDWSLYSALGVAYDQLGDQPNAKFAYEHALSLKPGEPAILNNFAMSRMLAGDTAAARALMIQAQASGSTDPKIAANLALLNKVAPVPAATAVAAAPVRTPVARNIVPPALGAPAPIAQAPAQIVMQAVPFDPLAGPVARRVHPGAKPANKPTHLAKPAAKPTQLAATAPKPPKKAKPSAANHIPALRMTADASKP